MQRRILYPGPLTPPEIILVTGSVYSATMARALPPLADGVRSRGYTVTTCAQTSTRRAFSEVEQRGLARRWDLDYDVVLVDMGEYLAGWRNFRYGTLPELRYTRCLFFTPVAEPAVSNNVELDFEREQRDAVREQLGRELGRFQLHLVRPSLVRPSPAEMELLETPEDMPERRAALRAQAETDRVPALERPLWK